MRVGIVSDSHDNLPAIARAVSLFKARECELVIHAGDIISPFSAKLFVTGKWRIESVYGNNDGEKKGLRKVLPGIRRPPLVLDLDNRKVIVAHKMEQLDPEIPRRKPWVGIHGHDHKAKVETEGAGLIINPGECCGYLTGRSTVAIWDTQGDTVDIIET